MNQADARESALISSRAVKIAKGKSRVLLVVQNIVAELEMVGRLGRLFLVKACDALAKRDSEERGSC